MFLVLGLRPVENLEYVKILGNLLFKVQLGAIISLDGMHMVVLDCI